jgi:pyrroloquinoline quinone biosynthesis protein D
VSGSAPRFAPGVRLQFDDVRNEHLLLMPEGVVKLNPSAVEVLELCNGVRTKAEIVTELETRYPGSSLAGDVDELLGALAQKGLVLHVA